MSGGSYNHLYEKQPVDSQVLEDLCQITTGIALFGCTLSDREDLSDFKKVFILAARCRKVLEDLRAVSNEFDSLRKELRAFEYFQSGDWLAIDLLEEIRESQ